MILYTCIESKKRNRNKMVLKGSSNGIFLFEFFYVFISWISCALLYVFGWHSMRIVSSSVLHHNQQHLNIGIVSSKFSCIHKSSHFALWILYLYAENLFKTTYFFVPYSSLDHVNNWTRYFIRVIGKCINIYFYQSTEECAKFIDQNQLKNVLYFDTYFLL